MKWVISVRCSRWIFLYSKIWIKWGCFDISQSIILPWVATQLTVVLCGWSRLPNRYDGRNLDCERGNRTEWEQKGETSNHLGNSAISTNREKDLVFPILEVGILFAAVEGKWREGGRERRPSWDGQGLLVLRSPKGLASRTNGFFCEFFSYGLLRGSEGTELILCVFGQWWKVAYTWIFAVQLRSNWSRRNS